MTEPAYLLIIKGELVAADSRKSELYRQLHEAEVIVECTFEDGHLKLEVTKNQKGRADVDAMMRVKDMQNVWAVGDCASIPDQNGKPYPPLAQHALREAKTLAQNITAVIRSQEPRPFIYASKGTLAALGHFKGAGQVYGINIHGFLAWWVWRTYYLMRMPPWSRRLRIVIDWTVALFFRNDVVQLDQIRGNMLASRSE